MPGRKALPHQRNSKALTWFLSISFSWISLRRLSFKFSNSFFLFCLNRWALTLFWSSLYLIKIFNKKHKIQSDFLSLDICWEIKEEENCRVDQFTSNVHGLHGVKRGLTRKSLQRSGLFGQLREMRALTSVFQWLRYVGFKSWLME